MDTNDVLSIGELAKLCNITTKTLRYYNKLDLLKPYLILNRHFDPLLLFPCH